MTTRRPRRLCTCAVLLLPTTFLLNVLHSHGFQPIVPIVQVKKSNNRKNIMYAEDDNNNNDLQDDDSVNDWLDKPFFDPLAYDDDDNSTWQAQLANFVKSDYNIAELVYAGVFITFMMFVSQELFRMQIYGADYVPFTSNSQALNPLWKQ